MEKTRIKMNIQFFGGRGAGSGGLEDGPTPGGGGGGSDAKYGQPNTPQMRPPAPTIEGQIGAQGEPQSPAEAMERVNPDRRALDAMEYEDYTSNCQRCVVAYELNRRGYNVEAEATFRNDPYPSMNHWMTAFEGATIENVGATTNNKVNSNIKDKMSTWGNGSRAIVKVQGGGGGHVFNVEYRGGKLYYYDAQTNTRYDPKRVFNHVNKRAVSVVRTDNLKIGDNVRDMVRKSRKAR